MAATKNSRYEVSTPFFDAHKQIWCVEILRYTADDSLADILDVIDLVPENFPEQIKEESSRKSRSAKPKIKSKVVWKLPDDQLAQPKLNNTATQLALDLFRKRRKQKINVVKINSKNNGHSHADDISRKQTIQMDDNTKPQASSLSISKVSNGVDDDVEFDDKGTNDYKSISSVSRISSNSPTLPTAEQLCNNDPSMKMKLGMVTTLRQILTDSDVKESINLDLSEHQVNHLVGRFFRKIDAPIDGFVKYISKQALSVNAEIQQSRQ